MEQEEDALFKGLGVLILGCERARVRTIPVQPQSSDEECVNRGESRPRRVRGSLHRR